MILIYFESICYMLHTTKTLINVTISILVSKKSFHQIYIRYDVQYELTFPNILGLNNSP